MDKWKNLLRKLNILLGIVLATTIISGQTALAQDTPPEPGETPPTVHIVQTGETIEEIAEQYGVSAAALQEANQLDSPASVVPGQRLIIPPAGYDEISPADLNLVIGFSDSLYTIAAQYDTPVEQLGASIKAVNPNGLYVGQEITIPSSTITAGSTPAGLTRLGKGLSLWQLALHTNDNLTALATRNHITDTAVYAPGKLVTLPEGTPSGTVLPPPWETISFHPNILETGRSAGLRVNTTLPGTLTGRFMDGDLDVLSEAQEHTAIIGINRWAEPGIYVLQLNFESTDGTTWQIERSIQLTTGRYGREVIRLPENIAALLDDPEIVQGELIYLSQNMSGFTAERYWEGLFLLPSPGVMTSAFGTVRSYNDNGYNSFHSGVDLAAASGTPIFAPADGVVVDTGVLDIRGLSTIISHGQGVYTGYWHQSGILVNPGDIVVAGQQIGMIGNTGLSTAPHVHWEMWVNGNQVDPMQWIRESFP